MDADGRPRRWAVRRSAVDVNDPWPRRRCIHDRRRCVDDRRRGRVDHRRCRLRVHDRRGRRRINHRRSLLDDDRRRVPVRRTRTVDGLAVIGAVPRGDCRADHGARNTANDRTFRPAIVVVATDQATGHCADDRTGNCAGLRLDRGGSGGKCQRKGDEEGFHFAIETPGRPRVFTFPSGRADAHAIAHRVAPAFRRKSLTTQRVPVAAAARAV